MNIPEDKIIQYPADNSIVVKDTRLFNGVLQTAKSWGTATLAEPGSGNTDDIEEVMAEYADKVADLRAKYEVQGELLNGKTAVEAGYYDELNSLQVKYRTELFKACLEYVADESAVGLMQDVLFNDEKNL